MYRLLAYALTLLLGLSVLTGGLMWRQWQRLTTPITASRPYMSRVDIRYVTPERVLPLLADTSAADLAWAALRADDPITVQVLIGHDLDSLPAQRISLLTAYIKAYPDASPETLVTARRLYHTAILHPYLSDAERLDALLFLAPRWRAWNQEAALRATLRSTRTLLQTSRSLRPEQRRRALRVLRELDTASDPLSPADVPPSPPALPPRLLLPFPVPDLPQDVRQAYDTRRQAAATLARNPTDNAAQTRLAAALRAEHLARETFYRHALAATPTPEAHIALAWDRVRWRHIVTLIAEREVGLSLVPEWEAQQEEHTVALIKAWENLTAQLADWVASQPDILWADQGAYELWSWIAWAGEWGLYPRYPRPYVRRQLTLSQERFFAHPDAPHRGWIVLDERSDPPWYALVLPPE